MSVYRIQIRDGKKVMLPVHSREEYMAIRDSEENRRADKTHMVQMNYSLSPTLPHREGEPIPLKGCKTPSNSVGMDIDLNEQDFASEKETHAIRDRILGKKDELGLLMLEESATKGYHLVFRRHPEMSQEENLKWASEVLGVAYDKGAKDITRVFYTPADKLVYLDDEIFCTDVIDETKINAQKVGEKPIKVSDPLIGEKLEKATVQNLTAFDLCVKEAGLDPEQMDVWGEHNWHNNLMAVLSVGLMKLMPKEQLRAVIKAKLPNYSETEDCQKLIDYFYANYQADMGFMSVTLREINAKAQASLQPSPTGEGTSDSDDDKVMSELTAGWDPPKMPKKLPRLVELEIRNFDSRYHEPLAMSATVGHAGLASHFRATYLNNKVITPASMASVIGGSGSGKDNCTQLFDIQCRYTLEENDKREMEKVKANTELREKMEKAKDRPIKYHPKIRLFEAASKTSLLELQTNIGENGMLVGIYSEADGFVSSSSAAWSNISVILRKGFGGEKHRQFYMSESTCNTQVSMNISLLVEGTPRAVLERMFSDKNCENGLVQRFIPVLMPKQKRTFRPPKLNFLSADECKERDALLMELYQKDLALGDETLVLETPKTNNAIGQWYDSLEELYNDGLLTEAEADLSHRCGEFMLKAAIPLIVLYGETKEVIDYAIWVGRMAFYNMCRIYGHRVQADINASNELLTANLDGRKTAEPLLSKMPDVFSLQAFKEQRIKDGQSPEVKTLLSRYCKKGKIQRISRGLYRKCT